MVFLNFGSAAAPAGADADPGQAADFPAGADADLGVGVIVAAPEPGYPGLDPEGDDILALEKSTRWQS